MAMSKLDLAKQSVQNLVQDTTVSRAELRDALYEMYLLLETHINELEAELGDDDETED